MSYRAQLAGWRFLFLSDVEVPGEIPVEINGFKSQQHRWTKGAVQVAKKLLFRIWRSDAAVKAKVEATFHLTANICYILMLLMALLTLPVLNIRTHLGWERLLIIDLPLFSFATMAISGFYLASQRALYPDWKRQIKLLPMLMAMGMSLCINNTRAVIEGWIGYETPFLRTPKYGVTNATHAPHKPLLKSTHRACTGRIGYGRLLRICAVPSLAYRTVYGTAVPASVPNRIPLHRTAVQHAGVAIPNALRAAAHIKKAPDLNGSGAQRFHVSVHLILRARPGERDPLFSFAARGRRAPCGALWFSSPNDVRR